MRHVSTISTNGSCSPAGTTQALCRWDAVLRLHYPDHNPRDLTARYLSKQRPLPKNNFRTLFVLDRSEVPHVIKLTRLTTCDVITGSSVRICPHVSNAHSLVPQANILMGRDICIPLPGLKPNISTSFYKDFQLILSINSGTSLHVQQPS